MKHTIDLEYSIFFSTFHQELSTELIIRIQRIECGISKLMYCLGMAYLEDTYIHIPHFDRIQHRGLRLFDIKNTHTNHTTQGSYI